MQNSLLAQIIDNINCGIVVLNPNFEIVFWNKWMEINSKMMSEVVLNKSLFDVFPHLKNEKFIKQCKSTLMFGNFTYLSQKLHQYIFPFKPIGTSGEQIDKMQQTCAIFPIRDQNNKVSHVCITVYDVTDLVIYQMKLIELSRTDMLTGINNRGYLEQRLIEEWERHKRHKRPLSIIMFDIDDFKKVNDNFGHLAGDIVLKTIAKVSQSNLREIDIIGRYGGEEFCCILPDTELKDAYKVAERIRLAIQNETIVYKSHNINVTISGGVADVTDNMKDYDELFRCADNALYVAKKSGKNRIEIISTGGK
ncbi:MAG: sensor domain-containing diguanylate cyclase [Thermodesulfovibrionales bacterium]|nr:sensor domain-containing diguanylate cyclase [Thermodesulfovibrionales bacterium]